VLKFTLQNTSNQAKLLSYGHRPFNVILNPDAYRDTFLLNKSPTYELNWQRVPSDCEYRKNE